MPTVPRPAAGAPVAAAAPARPVPVARPAAAPVARPASAPRPVAAQARPAAAPAGPAEFATSNPDEMSQGLQDDFDGVVLKARYVPFDYEGKLDHHVLAVQLTIQPDGETPFIQHYPTGAKMDEFVPCNLGPNGEIYDIDFSGDGSNGTWEGTHARRVGKKTQIANSSNWGQFTDALKVAGVPPTTMVPDIRWVEGLYGHWNRLPPKRRSGLVANVAAAEAAAGEPGAQARTAKDILFVTEYKGMVETQGAPAAQTAPAARPAAAAPARAVAPRPAPAAAAAPPAAAPATEDDFDAELDAIVLAQVLAAGEAGISKATLPAVVMSAVAGPMKAKAVSKVSNPDWLGGDSRSFLYDPEQGLLIPMPQQA